MASEQLSMIVNMLRATRSAPDAPVEQLRAGIEAMASAFTVPADVRCERVDAGGVPAEWVVAPGA